MPASRTAAETVPGELLRQSERVDEQLVRLGALLDIITERLEDMSNMMANYSPDLVTQFRALKTSLESYKTKANTIYKEIASSLSTYATSLLHYLDELTNNVAAIEQSVRDLY